MVHIPWGVGRFYYTWIPSQTLFDYGQISIENATHSSGCESLDLRTSASRAAGMPEFDTLVSWKTPARLSCNTSM